MPRNTLYWEFSLAFTVDRLKILLFHKSFKSVNKRFIVIISQVFT